MYKLGTVAFTGSCMKSCIVVTHSGTNHNVVALFREKANHSTRVIIKACLLPQQGCRNH